MIDVVIKTKNMTACNARLKQLGILVRDGENGDPLADRQEDKYEIVNTPYLVDVNNDIHFTIRMSQEQTDKIPKNDTPNFSTIWRSDEVDENGDLYPWPEFEVVNYDIDGNPDGTRMVGVGRII